MIKRQAQKMYETHQVNCQAYRKCLLRDLGNSIYIPIISFDLSNPTYQSYKVQSISTMNSIHLVVSMVDH